MIGDDYLRIAYEAAREADPDAVLFYDDFYDDVAVTQDAVASGVPIVPGANAERTTCDAARSASGCAIGSLRWSRLASRSTASGSSRTSSPPIPPISTSSPPGSERSG